LILGNKGQHGWMLCWGRQKEEIKAGVHGRWIL